MSFGGNIKLILVNKEFNERNNNHYYGVGSSVGSFQTAVAGLLQYFNNYFDIIFWKNILSISLDHMHCAPHKLIITLYIGGEELFGLPVTEYDELQRIRRELGLLQKLYSLYNSVIENVNGYQDILWSDIDVEKINGELLEYQNR